MALQEDLPQQMQSHFIHHECVHRRRQRHAEVDLIEAEETPVVPHDPVVVGHGQHESTGKGVAIDGRNCRNGEEAHAQQQPVHKAEERGSLVGTWNGNGIDWNKME